jgi:hypothetical protein
VGMQETEFKAVTQEAMIENRYAKQILFRQIGPGGQEKISQGAAAVIGLGALGTVIATHLCRAGEFLELSVRPRPECPACGRGRYEYLAGSHTSYTTVLCGRNAVQITPPRDHDISLDQLQERLGRVGKTSFNGFLLTFEAEGRELTLFPTGGAVIRSTTDEAEARTLYAKYVGL